MPFRDDSLLCIELGSYETRTIFGVAESLGPPKIRTRTRVGKRKDSEDYVCGEELEPIVSKQDSGIDIIYPLVSGCIVDLSALTAFLQNLIQTLTNEVLIPETKTSDIPVVIIAPPQWSASDKDNVTKVFMEQFLRPAFMIIDSAAASLYACNSMTGLVIDVGHEKTDITSIIDSLPITNARISVPLGGRHLTEHLLAMLQNDRPLDQGTQLPLEPHQIDLDLAEAIKRSQICETQIDSKTTNVMAFQADPASLPNESDEGVLDIAAVVASGQTREYLAKVQAQKSGANGTTPELVPNNQLTHNTVTIGTQTLVVGQDRFKVADKLLEDTQLTDAIWNSIMNHAIEPARRHELWENIVIVGGGSKIKGFRERLIQVLQTRFASVMTQASSDPYSPALYSSYPVTIRAIKIPVHFPEWNSKELEDGKGVNEDATFLGGCIIAHIAFASSESGSTRLYITKADYEEQLLASKESKE